MPLFMGDTGDWKLAMLRFTCEGFLFTCDGVTVEVWRCCRCQCSRLRYIQLFKIILLAVWTSSEVIVAITAIKSSILAWRQLTTSSQNIQTKSVLLNRLKDWKRQPMHYPYSSTELSSKTSISLTKQRHRLPSESIELTHHLQKTCLVLPWSQYPNKCFIMTPCLMD